MIRSVSPRNFDWLMFPIICIILTIGILFIWSASSEKFVFKQLVWIAVGLTLFLYSSILITILLPTMRILSMHVYSFF